MTTDSMTLLDAIPGVSVPVKAVPGLLSHMWDSDVTGATPGEASFRASQMNLILHFGVSTSIDEARLRFDTAIEFAQRYPCRIVVLCPARATREEGIVLESKIFSQCYIGKNLQDFCCCEALVLGYRVEDARFLENQVSLWLETDLPVYHWFNRVAGEKIDALFQPFIKQATRVIYDSGVDEDLRENASWRAAAKVRDLAYARTLPLRQHIGQFLSVYSPEVLADGLASVEVRAAPEASGEARCLLDWLRAGIARCLSQSQLDPAVDFSLGEPTGEGGDLIEIEWTYAKPDCGLQWEYRQRARTGQLNGGFGNARLAQPLHIEPLSRAMTLAEALFF